MQGVSLRGRIYWLRFSVGGVRRCISLETTDEAEAITKARELMADGPLAASGSWENEVEWYLSKRKRDGGVGDRYIPDLRYTLHHVAKQLAAIGADAPLHTRPFHIIDWLAGDYDVKARTLRSYADDARRFFKALEDARRIGASPFSDVRLPKMRKSVRRNFLSEDEAETLLAEVDKEDDGDLGFVVRCGLFAGLRKGEILAAKRHWFDLEHGLLHITRTEEWEPKDREERTIPLLARFSDWLTNFQGIRGEKHAFAVRPKAICNNWRYRWDFAKAYNNRVKRAKLDCNFHDLRRTFASRLVSNGASIYKVAVWLGDDVEVVQAHYGFLSPKDDDIELMSRKKDRIYKVES